jgi:hypothetical protein
VADGARQPVRAAVEPLQRAADEFVGGPRAVRVGRHDGIDLRVRPQQRDQPVVVERLAEVHVTSAAPRAEADVAQCVHALSVPHPGR